MLKWCFYYGDGTGKVRGRSGEGLSGLVGNVVFFSYNGETYFRPAPGKSVKNSWSERQILHRERFRAIKAFRNVMM